jgi:hypothetical protein
MKLNCGTVYVYYCATLKNPHDKIALCISERASRFFWFNSLPNFHGIAQLPIRAGEHGACSKSCYLDLSTVWTVDPADLVAAKDRGPISASLCARIIPILSAKISMLSDIQREMALRNLSAFAATLAAPAVMVAPSSTPQPPTT